MIYTLQQERLADAHQEWLVMEAAYWEGAAENLERPANDWDYETYYKMESLGRLKLYTARLETTKQLIGFDLYFLIYALHHQDHLVAMCDSLAVDKDFRSARVGRALMAFAEYELRKLQPAVSWITHNSKCNRTSSPLFQSLGYTPDEITHTKRM